MLDWENQLLGFLLPIVIPIVVMWVSIEVGKILQYLRKEYYLLLDEKQRALIESLTSSAVAMAEQMGISDKLLEAGNFKKSMAFNWIDSQLRTRGINVTAEYIEGLIEAAVLDLNKNKTKTDIVNTVTNVTNN